MLTRLPNTFNIDLKDLVNITEGATKNGIVVWPVSLLGDALKQTTKVLQEFIHDISFLELFKVIAIVVSILAVMQTLLYMFVALLAMLVIALVLWIAFKILKRQYTFGNAFNLVFGGVLGIYTLSLVVFVIKLILLSTSFVGPVTEQSIANIGGGLFDLFTINFAKWHFVKIGELFVGAYLAWELIKYVLTKKATK